MACDAVVSAALRRDGDLDALVDSIQSRFDLGLRSAEPPEGSRPVVFTPAGLAAILLPLEMSLSGKAVVQGTSKLGESVGQEVFDPRLSLTDDPLALGRASSRPFDDEAVPSRTLPLVERGTVRGFVYVLATAARAGTGTTRPGHLPLSATPPTAYSSL